MPVRSEVASMGKVPVANAERARTQASEVGADLLVSVGGGSTTGLAKAVALTTGLPIVAVPTTYAGSEATNVWGLTESSRKTTGSDDRVLPVTVIYDAALTASLPGELAVASGCNALAHCVDSMWAPRTDPINQALAVEGIRALSGGLREITGVAGREQMLYGAYLSAVAFASAGSGLHHKICHVLGGAYDLPHAEMHAVILPHALVLVAPSEPVAMARIGAALANLDVPAAVYDLAASVGAPTDLRTIGMPAERLDEAARLIEEAIPGTPKAFDVPAIRALLDDAFEGRRPTSGRAAGRVSSRTGAEPPGS